MLWLAISCTGKSISELDSGGPPAIHENIPNTDVFLDKRPSWRSTEWGYTTGAAFADMDMDGDPDVITAEGNDMTPGPLRIYQNNDGHLESTAHWVSLSSAYHGHLSTGDVDGDGDTDVVVSRFLGDGGFQTPGGVDLYLNSPAGLSQEPDWSASGFFSFSNALGDMDLDGDLDLAVAVGEAYQNDPDYSRVYRNDGNGGYTLAWTAAVPRYAFDVAWVDREGYGDLDLVFAHQQSGHGIYDNDEGQLSGTPVWEATGNGFEGNTLDWGDANGDGAMDLLISDNNQLGGVGQVRLFCGPDFSMCWESEDATDMQSTVSLRDVDRDGRLDVIAGAWWGAVRIYRNGDTGIETTPSWTSENQDIVNEAFIWADVDRVDAVQETVSFDRLLVLERGARPLEVVGGVAGDGVITGPGMGTAVIEISGSLDLLVTDWTPEEGNWLFISR